MAGTAETDLSVIIVSFDGADLLRECLHSVYRETSGVRFEVIVIDNASADGSPEVVREEFPAARLVENSENCGFAKATNQGIRLSAGRHVLLLNPDTVVVGNALAKLVAFMDDHGGAGAAGGRLRNEDGTVQYSIRNFPTLGNQLAESVFLHRLFSGVLPWGEMVCQGRAYDKTHVVGWVSGAFLVMRRAALDQIGLLDERYFLYVEETDWCYRLARAGMRTYYYPKAEVIHLGGDYGKSEELFAQLMKSRMLFFAKHSSRPRAWAFRKITFLNLIVRLGVWSAIGRVTGQQTARERCRAYVGGFAALTGLDRQEA